MTECGGFSSFKFTPQMHVRAVVQGRTYVYHFEIATGRLQPRFAEMFVAGFDSMPTE
jgi:hypothetical protein